MITDLDQQVQDILFFVLLFLFVCVEKGFYQLLDADLKLGNPLPCYPYVGLKVYTTANPTCVLRHWEWEKTLDPPVPDPWAGGITGINSHTHFM